MACPALCRTARCRTTLASRGLFAARLGTLRHCLSRDGPEKLVCPRAACPGSRTDRRRCQSASARHRRPREALALAMWHECEDSTRSMRPADPSGLWVRCGASMCFGPTALLPKMHCDRRRRLRASTDFPLDCACSHYGGRHEVGTRYRPLGSARIH